LNNPYTLIVICGPTAVGKTHFAIQLAKHFNTSIISADSRQFYREMNIGTAKPTPDELKEVPHHFINNLSIYDEYSAGQFEEETLEILNQHFEKKPGVPIIMAGGSGLFIQAVCEGFDNLPGIDKNVRENLNQQYQLKGIEFLQVLLEEKDPVYFKLVDQKNPQRLIRALEVIESTGKTFTSYRNRQPIPRKFKSIYFGLQLERTILYERINNRVEEMMKKGLLKEVKKLLVHKHLNALQTVGYQELFDHLDGITTLEESVELIKRNSRRYAKRQMTWFRRIENIHWFQPDEVEKAINFVNKQK